MPRYINLDELLTAIDQRNGRLPLWLDEILMDDCKVADVEPVKHGKWLINSDGYYPYCSICGIEPTMRIMSKFCPNCGAKMEGDAN